jgi:hypothetical protein
VESRFWARWWRLNPGTRILLATILSCLMALLPIVARALFASEPLPEAWSKFASLTRPVEVCVSLAGGMCGLGIALARVTAWFDAGGEWLERIFRFVIAVVLLGLAELASRLLLKYIVPHDMEGLRLAIVFAVRAGQALLAWDLIPQLFLRLNLVQPSRDDTGIRG